MAGLHHIPHADLHRLAFIRMCLHYGRPGGLSSRDEASAGNGPVYKLGTSPKTVKRLIFFVKKEETFGMVFRSDDEKLSSQEFDFETVHNIDVAHGEFDPSFRSTIKHWNMCIQYWLAFVVYKRFPNKALRTAVVFAVSAYWHGVYLGYYCCLLAPPFYLPIEDIWHRLFIKEATGVVSKI